MLVVSICAWVVLCWESCVDFSRLGMRRVAAVRDCVWGLCCAGRFMLIFVAVAVGPGNPASVQFP